MVAVASKFVALSWVQPLHELLPPPHSPHSSRTLPSQSQAPSGMPPPPHTPHWSITAEPPHTPSQSGAIHEPSSYTAVSSKLHAVESVQPGMPDMLHSSTTSNPNSVPSTTNAIGFVIVEGCSFPSKDRFVKTPQPGSITASSRLRLNAPKILLTSSTNTRYPAAPISPSEALTMFAPSISNWMPAIGRSELYQT